MRPAVFLGMIALFFLFVAGLSGAESPDKAEQVIKQAADRPYNDLTLHVDMVKTTKSGLQREMRIEVRMKKAEGITKTLAEFVAPSHMVGMKSLTWSYADPDTAADQWFKLYGTDYIKCVGKACRNMEDRFGFNTKIFSMQAEDADHTLLDTEQLDGNTCYQIRIIPKNPQMAEEAKIILWVDKQKSAVRRIEAFDEKGNLLYTSVFTEFEKIGDHFWETKGTMTYPESGKKISFEIKQAELNTGIPDQVFAKPEKFSVE